MLPVCDYSCPFLVSSAWFHRRTAATPMKIRAIIVDDEPLARQRVRLLLAEEPDIDILAECPDAFHALDQILATKPDLLFLDVQMPEMDGFELLRRLPQSSLPVVIFTTAYDQHALHAFEVSALDYLLKPFKPARFKEAVQRARDLIANKQASLAVDHARGLLALLGQAPVSGPVGEGRIVVRSAGRILFLKPVEIDRV